MNAGARHCSPPDRSGTFFIEQLAAREPEERRAAVASRFAWEAPAIRRHGVESTKLPLAAGLRCLARVRSGSVPDQYRAKWRDFSVDAGGLTRFAASRLHGRGLSEAARDEGLDRVVRSGELPVLPTGGMEHT